MRCTSWLAIDHGHADLAEALEQLHDLEREIGIEIAGGLIRNEQLGFRHHGARDADALLLAGRELERPRLLLAEQAHLVERRAHAFVDFAPGTPAMISGSATLSATGRSCSSL